MLIESIILLCGSGLSVSFWYFWQKMYADQEKNIRLLEYQVPPLYDDVPMVVPAPDYEEDDPRRPLTAPPQY